MKKKKRKKITIFLFIVFIFLIQLSLNYNKPDLKDSNVEEKRHSMRKIRNFITPFYSRRKRIGRVGRRKLRHRIKPTNAMQLVTLSAFVNSLEKPAYTKG